MSKLTSNQLYGGMNRRFEKRSKMLAKFGFKYKIVVKGIAAFIHPRSDRSTVAAAEVMHSNNQCWIDTLRSILKGPVY